MNSSAGGNLHSKRLPSESERGQRCPDVDAAQQLKLRERQRFFEEVFQHDVDVYLSSAHLCIRDYKRPPIGSVSSMEVNVDLLDQMELIEISDQESLDVFFSSVGEEGALASPLPECRGGGPKTRESACPQPPAERGGSVGGCPPSDDHQGRAEETGGLFTAVLPPLTSAPSSSQVQPSSGGL